MYRWDNTRPLTIISREEFVKFVFEIGTMNGFGLDTIVESIKLGDKYRTEYSLELGYVTISIISKYNEDDSGGILEEGFHSVNKYVITLEQDILKFIDYRVKINNFASIIKDIYFCNNTEVGSCYYHSIFYDICLDVCLNKELLNLNALTIILGVVILYKRGWLKAIKDNKHRQINNFIQKVVDMYEIDHNDLLTSCEIVRSKRTK